ALQPDGKILIAEGFPSSQKRIRRLNNDGTPDISFENVGASDRIQSMVPYLDGKILIGGDFTVFMGAPSNRIALLNSNGTLDASFNPSTGADGRVKSIVLQPDGKVLIGG